jgi:hypothetical protein
MTDFSEIAYGSYHGCEKCGVSELLHGWDCVCDLLIANGNCQTCLYTPEYCTCDEDIFSFEYDEYEVPCSYMFREDEIPFGFASSYRVSST